MEIVLPTAVVVLLWVGLAAGQGGGMGGGMISPPPPPKVDLSDNFVALWDTVDFSVTLSNAHQGPEDLTMQMSRALTISGVVDVLDSQNVMGISTNNMKIVRALDESECPIQCAGPLTAQTIPTYQTFTGPAPFTIRLNLDQNEAWPLGLNTVECRVVALYAQNYEFFDIPFALSEQWIVLKPGISARVEQAQCDGIEYRYILRIRYEGTDPTRFDTSRYTSHLPHDMVMGIQLLNAQGVPVPESETGSLQIDNTSIRTGRGLGAEVQILRLKLAINPYNETITLLLTDLLVPVF